MKIKNTLFVLCIGFLIIACGKEKVKIDNIYKFKKFVSYTTNGIVSTTENITVGLNQNVENWKKGTKISSDILTISPFVNGSIVATHKHSFVFIPDDRLDSNTEYTVTLKLNEIFKNIEKKLENYTFQFKTLTPNFSIDTKNLQSYSKKWQYLEGALHSADFISLKQAKKLIKARHLETSKNIVWEEVAKERKVFEFKIDSIERFVEDSDLSILWDGKPINASSKGENQVLIPGFNNFKIINLEVRNLYDQYLSINFSDPLQKQQNFDGLVSVQHVKNPKYIVNGNELKVYLNQKLGGNVLVTVYQGIKNTDGYKLKKNFVETITFSQKKPQIRLINNGVILPNSNALNFNFEAVNVREVDVRIIKIFENNVLQFLQEENLSSKNESALKKVGRRVAKKTITLIDNPENNNGHWKTYSVDISKMVATDPGAIYRVELSFNKNQTLYNCGETTKKTKTIQEIEFEKFNKLLASKSEDDREELYWDNKLYRYRNYEYNWQERENPCFDVYYNDNEMAQNILASNLGIIVKKSKNDSYNFTISNILTTDPEANATIKLYNLQQQEIAIGNTDSRGFSTIESTKNASFAVVSKGQNKGYIKLFDGNSLSLSKFDVSGRRLQKGLKGYIYGERGVWRPGDLLHLTFLLNDEANKLPKNHPIKMEITDPSGKVMYQKITTENLENFYTFQVPTSPGAKTGNYTAKVSVGGAVFRKNLKIETIKPNRLKIKIDFENEILSNKKPIDAFLDVKWLHGTPAKNLKVEVKAKISSSNFRFKDYKQYVFSDPSRNFETEELNLFEGNVDENGLAKISKNLTLSKKYPGMLNVQFLVRAFENGGDFSIDAFTKKFAPFSSFVGLNSPEENDNGAFSTDENYEFSVISVNEKGNPVARKNLEVEVYEIEWRWWWSSSRENLSRYTSSSYHRPVNSFKINTNSKGHGKFTLNIDDDDRGRYLIRVIDPKSGHATGRTAYFYKNWWQDSSLGNKDAAKMLVFSADKKTYKVGETAKVTFPSGNDGNALISVENSTEILEQKWVKTRKGTTTTTIKITKKMTPNVFFSISLLQPHSVSENDLPLRLYGTIPILVEDPTTQLFPEISMPDELQPEKEFSVSVSEKNQKEMTYTLAIVEEGLLDLTRFKTPNAYSLFYAREALGIKTWDIYDDIMGAYSGSIDQIFAIGGDGNASKAKNKKASRFKPVVKFLGPFHLKKGSKKSHKITLPNYIGSVRTMVVAGDVKNGAYGKTDKATPVKKPLMVLATLPRKLSPKEKVTLPVTIFAMDKKMKNVSVSVKTTRGISVIGETMKKINFDKPDEKMLYFELDVLKANGINKVEIIAVGNGEKSRHEVELDVLNPNLITSKIIDQKIEKRQTQTLNFTTFGEGNSNTTTIELSTIPPINFSGRLEYLIQYPHGCVEQTTSSVFPQLFLADIFDISVQKKQEIQRNIERGIARLGRFQKANGGLSYWIGENYISDWGTSYAGHFMLEASKKGYVLPLTFKSNFVKYQKDQARNWKPSYRGYNTDLAQAYRLYTLALANSPDLSSMNRLREYKQISNNAKWRLAAAYALVGQKEAAGEIVKSANLNFANTTNYYYSYGSEHRNRAMALETLLTIEDNNASVVAKTIVKELSSNRWMSTQTTAYSLMAIGKMVVKNGGKAINISYTNNGKKEVVKSSNALVQRNLNIQKGQNSITIINNENNVVFARIINAGKLPLGSEITEERGLKVTINYTDLDGNYVDIRKLKQGQDFVAKIKVSKPRNVKIRDIALTQIFPSGWEIVNTRFTDFGDTTQSQARYTDIRDDRVNFYFDLEKSHQKTFSVMLNAGYLGTYYLPGVQVEAMYDNDYLVRTKGHWIQVVK